MRRLILYSTGECIQSRRLVSLLSNARLKFEEADANNLESRLKLDSMGISNLGSPLLVMDDNPLKFNPEMNGFNGTVAEQCSPSGAAGRRI